MKPLSLRRCLKHNDLGRLTPAPAQPPPRGHTDEKHQRGDEADGPDGNFEHADKDTTARSMSAGESAA